MTAGGVQQLQAAVDALADADVVGASQRDDLVGLWREIARLEAQFARRLAEFDTSVEWSVDGSRTAAGWLVKHVRAATSEAHHSVTVARQTAQMPLARTAWEAGRISSRHVDALVRVRHRANADAEFAVFEPALVDVALEGRPEDVTNVGQQWRDALESHLGRDGSEPKPKPAAPEPGRAYFSRSLEGRGVLDANFDTEGADIVDTGLKQCYDRLHQADDPRSPAEQRADAIVEIFRHYLDHQNRGTNRPHLMLVVDEATYADEAVGLCQTLSGYRLNPETMRRLSCDAFIQRIVLDSRGVPLEMGRAERTFTPDQHRAIMLRDGGCRMPGCDARPKDCEAHHRDYWEHGGLTDVDVGLAVCKGTGHHKLIHEGGWTITGDPNGELTFHDADGNYRGGSRPRGRPIPIPTRIGNEISQARQRAHALKHAPPHAA